jgi:hypothetical protein
MPSMGRFRSIMGRGSIRESGARTHEARAARVQRPCVPTTSRPRPSAYTPAELGLPRDDAARRRRALIPSSALLVSKPSRFARKAP